MNIGTHGPQMEITDEFRRRVIGYYNSGMDQKEIVSLLRTSPHYVRNVIKEYKSKTITDPKELEPGSKIVVMHNEVPTGITIEKVRGRTIYTSIGNYPCGMLAVMRDAVDKNRRIDGRKTISTTDSND